MFLKKDNNKYKLTLGNNNDTASLFLDLVDSSSVNNKKSYWFKAADVAKILNLTNIRVSIQNYDDSEKGVRKAYTPGGNQEIMYLSSQGIYRLLYSSKKEIAKQNVNKNKQKKEKD